MSADKKTWVCGFLFYSAPHELNVALVEKRHGPSVVVGKLNGIGGKVEAGELPHAAMVREFREEAGLLVPQWRRFCDLRVSSFGLVHMYAAHVTAEQAMQVTQQEDEPIRWLDVKKITYFNIVPNLRWLVPLALDTDVTHATVEDSK